MSWVLDNLASIIVGLMLLFAVIFAIRSIIRTHKKGGCAGCSESHCSGCAGSHKENGKTRSDRS